MSFLIYFIIKEEIITKRNNNIRENQKLKANKIIGDNFFVIDSNNLGNFQSHMYGFTISKKGILTDNYYKNLGYYEKPEPLGVYIMIRKFGKKIRIDQDFYGSFGLYLYEDKNTEYFALSNSFLLLEEHLVGVHNISFNKDFSDNLIISDLCSPSIHETLIKEIIKLPPNTFLIINVEKKIHKMYYIDYKEHSIPLESKEGLKIIDNWVDKWGYIIRSLRNQTNNIFFDLSGGFDTRIILSLLLVSGINLKDILINSYQDNKHSHDEDYEIATNISLNYGFKLNNHNLDNNFTNWSLKDILFCSLYTKLGFHKEFYLRDKYYSNPRFGFTGFGGEIIRGSPEQPINEYIKKISSNGRQIEGHEEEFYNSSMKLCNRSIILLNKDKNIKDDYEISSYLYSRGRARNHFGKSSVEAYIPNIYIIQPLFDPDIKRIKYNLNGNSPHDLIAYIYIRFGNDLTKFPIQGKRRIDIESIKKARKLNSRLPPYKIKYEYNSHFFIDISRKSLELNSTDKRNIDEYFRNLFKSLKFIKIINRTYDIEVYNWAKEYSNKSNFFPLRHGYGLLAIATALEFVSLNGKNVKKKNFEDIFNN